MSDYQPVHRQLRELLREQIESGHIPVGARLPPEVNLAKSFGVSRSTIRRAILDLTEEGLLLRKPRVGTIVLRSKVQDHRSWLRGVTEDLRNRGIESTTEVLSADWVVANGAVLNELRLSSGEEVLRLVRVRKIAGGIPLTLTRSYVPSWVGISPDSDFTRPLYQLMEQGHKLHITHGHDVLGAVSADNEVAEALDIETGTPLLQVRRTVFVEHERPVEFVATFVRSDLYEYHVTLPRRPAGV